ncbi:MAG: HlyC/CorC family transporter [Acidobacteria bacterium]|nr:HlyC/CorC family transporter [Acidobacteriota bacterium]
MGLSVFFAGSEIAFMSLNRPRLKYQAELGDRQAQAIRRIIKKPDRLLGVILLGNTVANIAAASLLTFIIATYIAEEYVDSISIAGSVVLTLVVLIFCELTPKIITATHPEHSARKLILPIRFSIWILSPFSRLAAWIANRIVRIVGIPTAASPFSLGPSEDEIRAMIAGSSANGMPVEKREMLDNIFEIGLTRVREVMIPRGEVAAVDIKDPVREILAMVNQTHYSRIPVFRQNFDNPLGILHVKDLLQHVQKDGAINLQALLRPAHFIPDSARLDTVLRQFQSMHLHMAIVVDEFGGVAGIVTLEDLLEEIVGEIRDEHDTEIDAVRELGSNLYSVEGNLPVKDFNRFFDSSIIPEAPGYTTLAGYLEFLAGRLLLEGETLQYQGFVFTIEKVEGFRIVSVRVRPLPSHAGTA